MTAFEVRGDGLTATVLPERGGRISSLRDRWGREWLAQPESALGQPPVPGSNFTEGDMAGWDECAPSIVACDVDGVSIPDHGELWTTEFDSVPPRVGATGSVLNYRFERAIVATPNGLRLEYSAVSLRGDVPFLWAAHPQFVAPDGSWLRVDDVTEVVDVQSDPVQRVSWTDERSRIDTVADRASRKFYLDPDRPRFEAALVHPDGRAMVMRWSEQCPYVGFWFDRRRYSRTPVIAIEPSTGFFDSLSVAQAKGLVAVLQPDMPLRWWVDLVVEE